MLFRSGLHNMVVQQADVYPYWGMFDFLLEVISVRYAVIEGTWGFEPE